MFHLLHAGDGSRGLRRSCKQTLSVPSHLLLEDDIPLARVLPVRARPCLSVGGGNVDRFALNTSR